MFGRRLLQGIDVLQTRLEDVLKTSWKTIECYAEVVFKTFSRLLQHVFTKKNVSWEQRICKRIQCRLSSHSLFFDILQKLLSSSLYKKYIFLLHTIFPLKLNEIYRVSTIFNYKFWKIISQLKHDQKLSIKKISIHCRENKLKGIFFFQEALQN